MKKKLNCENYEKYKNNKHPKIIGNYNKIG